MTVRRMSAQPWRFSAEIGLIVGQKTNKTGAQRAGSFPPKAEGTSSNLVGRANEINDLWKSSHTAGIGNSPQTHQRNVGNGVRSAASGPVPRAVQCSGARRLRSRRGKR